MLSRTGDGPSGSSVPNLSRANEFHTGGPADQETVLIILNDRADKKYDGRRKDKTISFLASE